MISAAQVQALETRRRRWIVVLSFVAVFLAVFSIAGTGCTTVVPTPAAVPSAASFDGGEQNSGIVGIQADGIFLVTAHLRARYNALVATYGPLFAPALAADAGLAPVSGSTLWRMTPEAMANFATMVQWRRMGRAAP